VILVAKLGFGIAKQLDKPYFGLMFAAFEFCIPATGTMVPASPDWFHENQV
jgi:hypothetical protein